MTTDRLRSALVQVIADLGDIAYAPDIAADTILAYPAVRAALDDSLAGAVRELLEGVARRVMPDGSYCWCNELRDHLPSCQRARDAIAARLREVAR